MSGNSLTCEGGFPFLFLDGVTDTVAWGTSSYNALQVNLERRFTAGLTTNINFTWSHSLQNGLGACVSTYSPAALGIKGGPSYPANLCVYDNAKNPTPTSILSNVYAIGNSHLDVPDRLAGTVSYDLPFGKSLTGVQGVLGKGWSVNADGFVQSGIPFGLTNGATLNGIDGGVDKICSGRSSHPTLQEWIDISCFRQPTIDTYGTETANQLFGLSLKAMDFSIFKNFDLTERFRLQFRTEIFNLFNTPNFAPGASGRTGNGATNITIPAFNASGVAVSQANPTLLQAGAITIRDPNIQAREIQFGLKLLF